MPPPKAPEEVPKKVRLDLAIEEYTQALSAYQNSSDPQKKKPAVGPIARSYGIVPSTLGRRVAGKTRSHQKAHEDQQRLSSGEEEALESWILQVIEWGRPPTVAHVRRMATALLVEKGDHKELGKNWVASFLERHQALQSRFSQPLDKERAATEPDIRHPWQENGLFPIQPHTVFDKSGLKAPEPRSLTPPPPEMTVTASNGDSASIPSTPANVEQVNQLVQQITAGNLDPALPEKLGKACISALAYNILLEITKNHLIKADQRKKDEAKHGQSHSGEVQIVNLEVVEQRMDDLAAKQFERQFRSMCHLGPSLFEDTKRSRSPVKNKTTATSAPGPLVPSMLTPPQQQQSQRGGRGRGGQGGRGGRGGRGAAVTEEVVEEEEAVLVQDVQKSRSGRTIKPKER